MTSRAKIKSTAIRETRMRSLVKALIYRFFSLAGTTLISWLITRDIGETIVLTLVIQVFLVVLYYTSERVWNSINWGREIR